MRGAPTSVAASTLSDPTIGADLVAGSSAPSPRAAALAPIAVDEFHHRLVKECLEDIGGIRHHRALEPDEGWRDARPAEERLLDQLDAIFACGPSTLTMFEEQLEDLAAGDVDDIYAHFLVLGCADWAGADELSLRLLRSLSPEDPDIGEAVVEAFFLSPRESVSQTARALLDDEEPGRRAWGLRSLSARRTIAADDLAAALDDAEAMVVAAAAACAVHLPELTGELSSKLEALGAHEDDAVATGALGALVQHGVPAGRMLARDFVATGRGAFADAARQLAIVGHRGDWPVFEAADWDDPVIIDAVGRFGDLRAFPLLVDALGGADEELAPFFAGALARLTGAEVTDTVEVESLDPGDEEFVDEVPDPDVYEMPSVDAARWQQWWNAARSGFDEGVRYRAGQREQRIRACWRRTCNMRRRPGR